MAYNKPDPRHNHGSGTHTSCDQGHSHYYKATSGPSIPLSNGWHAHAWNFYTTVDDGHRHHVHEVGMVALGI